jgi:hypothetical protein
MAPKGFEAAVSDHLRRPGGEGHVYLYQRSALASRVRRMTDCAAVALVWLLAGCGPSTAPEEAVRMWVSDAETAVENGDRRALMAMIAESYADSRGNDKADIERIVRVWFLRNRNILLASKTDRVTIIGDTAATVLLTAGMAGTGEGILDLSADAWRFELELVSDGRDWRLIGARWGELGGELR